jgi:hypothetical protein
MTPTCAAAAVLSTCRSRAGGPPQPRRQHGRGGVSRTRRESRPAIRTRSGFSASEDRWVRGRVAARVGERFDGGDPSVCDRDGKDDMWPSAGGGWCRGCLCERRGLLVERPYGPSYGRSRGRGRGGGCLLWWLGRLVGESCEDVVCFGALDRVGVEAVSAQAGVEAALGDFGALRFDAQR